MQSPDMFEPERFLEGTAAAKERPAHGWIPFGDGGRGCVGAKFGSEEAVLTLVRAWSALTISAEGALGHVFATVSSACRLQHVFIALCAGCSTSITFRKHSDCRLQQHISYLMLF